MTLEVALFSGMLQILFMVILIEEIALCLGFHELTESPLNIFGRQSVGTNGAN
jgi:hypothetical protein